LRHDKAILHPIQPKEHLKHIPDYLIPDSMRTVSKVQMSSKNHRKNRKRKIGGEDGNGQKKTKFTNDPLYSTNLIAVKPKTSEGEGGGDQGSVEGGAGGDGMLFATAPSGRKEWKMKHHKGEYNSKYAKGKAYQTPGTFQKSKKKLMKIAGKH
jgi:hypothetical protein